MFRNKRHYYLIFFIILFFSCSQLDDLFKFVKDKILFQKKKDKKNDKNKNIKKNKDIKLKKDKEIKKDKAKIADKKINDKKNKPVKQKIIVYIDKEYEKSFYGNLSKKIVVKFLKNTKKDYKITKIDSKFDPLKGKEPSFIVISDKNFKKLEKSRNLFSEALYFLINNEKQNDFKYPTSLKTMKVGIHYNSYAYNYLNEVNFLTGKKNFEITNNFKIYAEFSNMVEDFRIKKTDIILIERTKYYKVFRTLPSAFLFYIDIGKTFGPLYFKDKNLLKEFNQFMYKNKIKYDWINFL